MTPVDRLLSDLRALFTADPAPDDLKVFAHLHLSSFIGRVALRDHGYASLEEIGPLLQEGRNALLELEANGQAALIRLELIQELDNAIASVRGR